MINHSVVIYRYATYPYRIFHEIRKVVCSSYPFFKCGAVRSAMTDPFPLPDAISSFFSFPPFIRLSRSSCLSFLPFTTRSILFYISFRCPILNLRAGFSVIDPDEHLHNLLCIRFEWVELTARDFRYDLDRSISLRLQRPNLSAIVCNQNEKHLNIISSIAY